MLPEANPANLDVEAQDPANLEGPLDGFGSPSARGFRVIAPM